MYANNFHNGHVEVEYIYVNTNTLGHDELKYLPLPKSTEEGITMKLSFSILLAGILNGKCLGLSILPALNGK